MPALPHDDETQTSGTELLGELQGGPPKDELDRIAAEARRRLFGAGAGSLGSDSATLPAEPGLHDGAEPSPRTLSRGDAVGRYLILDRVGTGGMGVVYAAHDPELDRKVALKLLLPPMGSEGSHSSRGSARLLREAQAMARVSHPNVVAVHDVGLHQDAVYIAMEFVQGRPLTQWLEETDRSWREILQVFIEVGHGLAAAHACGLLHRDVKPDNVMVDDARPDRSGGTRRSAIERVRIMDFGLARSAAERDESDDGGSENGGGTSQRVTRAGAIAGTPAYMAPEQLLGRSLDARADQFSFCVSLWEALYGERPYDGANISRLAMAVLRGQRNRQRGCKKVPASLRRVLDRGLSVDADARWPDMHALLGALERIASRRRPLAWGAGAGGMAILAGLAVFAALPEDETRCSGARSQLAGVWDGAVRSEAQAAFATVDSPFSADAWTRTAAAVDAYATAWATMHTEACEATVIRGEQSAAVMDLRMACLQHARDDLSAVASVLVDADADVAERAHVVVAGLPELSRCADLHSLLADVDPPKPHESEAVDAVREMLALARAETSAGSLERATSELTRAIERLDEDRIEYGPIRTELARTQARVHAARGNFSEAEASHREALYLAARWDQRRELFSAAVSLMTVAGARRHEFDEALRYRELAQGLADGDPDREADVLRAVGHIRLAQGRYDEALQHFERTLELRRSLPDPDEETIAQAIEAVALATFRTGDYSEAIELQQQCLAMLEEIVGSGHPDVATALADLGAMQYSRGDTPAAQRSYERALSIYEGALEVEDVRIASVLDNLGLAYQDIGDLDGARRLHMRALAIREKSLGPDHAAVGSTLNNLANIDYKREQFDRAVAGYERALIIERATLGDDHPEVVSTEFNLANAKLELGAIDDAIALYEASLPKLEAAMGPDNPRVAYPLAGLARAALLQDRPEDAVALAERALSIAEGADLEPGASAKIRFVLARALAELGQRQRARRSAEQARDGYRQMGEAYSSEVREIDAWLAARSRP